MMLGLLIGSEIEIESSAVRPIPLLLRPNGRNHQKVIAGRRCRIECLEEVSRTRVSVIYVLNMVLRGG